MNEYLLILPILFPIIFAIINRSLKISEKQKEIVNLLIIILTAVFTILLVILPPEESCYIFRFNERLRIFLKLDGIGRIFTFMVCILWPFAYLYTMAYMQNEDKKKNYAMFYVITFGIVLGISLAGNLITMYVFYELLTLVTIPLIIHPMTKEAKRAGRYYLYISLFGSTLALIGIIMLICIFNTGDFINVFELSQLSIYMQHQNSAYVAYMLLFIGFGVKAAIFPLHGWLPRAGAAPTPTTALLHAVAVVKAGAFAIIRTIYSVMGCEILSGSVVQMITTMMASITILFGSSMALKQIHLKRRFAYSTIANISYILLAATMMNAYGLYAAMLHMIFHSFAKITLFFIAGELMKKADVIYVDQMNGLASKMPVTFVCYILAGFSLIGIPLFAGFISKIEIANSAILVNQWYSIVGIVCLLISALLTAIYVMDIILRAYFKRPNFYNIENYEKAKDGNYKFLLPICTFALCSFLLGMIGSPLLQVIEKLLGGGL